MLKLSGKRFGKLTVVKIYKRNRGPGKHILWLCKCDCGKDTIVSSSMLKSGGSKSCGCYKGRFISKKNSKHKMSNTIFWRKWSLIRSRCYRRYDISYKNYGGRGIKVCNKWNKSFENFRDDMYESYIEHVEEHGKRKTTIERIDNNKNYCKENCKWSTPKEQSNNRRNNVLITYNGKTKTLKQWSDVLGISDTKLMDRLRRKNRNVWSIERAFTTL